MRWNAAALHFPDQKAYLYLTPRTESDSKTNPELTAQKQPKILASRSQSVKHAFSFEKNK